MSANDFDEAAPDFAAEVRCEVPFVVADVRVRPGRTLGVIGPNGAGKSTLLDILAGLRRTPDSVVRLGDRMLQSGSTFVEAYRRSVVLLEQKPRLFPHMTVERNVGFGPAAAGLGRRRVAERVVYWLSAVGVADLAGRRPAELSGGQAQRVALARALAAEPDVLLLDEPFAALDVDVAQQMRMLVRSLLAERRGGTVLVTHDLVDVVGLADDVLVLDGGRVVDAGPTREVLARPGSRFTAALSGLNLLLGEYVGDGTVAGPDGRRIVATVDVGDAPGPGSPAAAAFSPRAVAVYLEAPHGSPRNVLHGQVVDVTPRGDHALVRSDCGGQTVDAEITWTAAADLGLGPGVPVSLVVKATEVRVYPASPVVVE
ncbi:ATP-binding cassette domain-containing protein [Gordonia sinesedis]